MAFEYGGRSKKRIPGQHLPEDVQGGQQPRDDYELPRSSFDDSGMHDKRQLPDPEPNTTPTPNPSPSPNPNPNPNPDPGGGPDGGPVDPPKPAPPPPPPPPPGPAPTPGPSTLGNPLQTNAAPQDFSQPSALEQKLIDQLTQTANQRDQYNQAIRSRLLDMIAPKPAPSIDDADIAPQQAAFSRTIRRANDRNRAATAERMAAEGTLQSGGFDSAVERGMRDVELAEANNAAGLVGEQLQRRMAELQSALQLGAGIMTNDEEKELRSQLALLDNEMRRTQFAGDLDLRKRGLGGQLNLGLLDLMMRDSQFNDQLGFNIGMYANQAARQNLLNLLG